MSSNTHPFDQSAAIVLAGGSGSRFGGRLNKVLSVVGDLPILLHALAPFSFLPEIVLVANERDLKVLEGEYKKKLRELKVTTLVPGGRRRQDSVWCGLQALSEAPSYVAIHDAARPLVSVELIRRVLRAAERYGAAVPALPVAETLKEADGDGKVRATVDRTRLHVAQTPQAFRRDLIVEAHEKNRESGVDLATDDSWMVEAIGKTVKIVPGDPRNLKVTRREDLEIVRALLTAAELETADTRREAGP